ncbi:hypothetical protein [Pelagibius sp.]|uniref:hypothetical protein n=1 Tax=Pelagibius sp. TaxID=1931238 RepID=UPI003B50CD2D
MKKHDILIEPWRGDTESKTRRGTTEFRWTVSYEKDGRFYAQGFADSHAEARAAAEAYLKEQGIDLNWQSGPSESAKLLKPRSKPAVVRGLR